MTRRKKDKPKLAPIHAFEREQVAIRRKLGLQLAMDEHGRERVPVGTADNRTITRTGAERFRIDKADPLLKIPGLSERQRVAGRRYAEAWDIAAGAGIKPVSMEMRVQSGSVPQGIPDHVIDATGIVRKARVIIGHRDIVAAVESVCCVGLSIRAAAVRMRRNREVIRVLLSIGLDKLADAYDQPRRRSQIR